MVWNRVQEACSSVLDLICRPRSRQPAVSRTRPTRRLGLEVLEGRVLPAHYLWVGGAPGNDHFSHEDAWLNVATGEVPTDAPTAGDFLEFNPARTVTDPMGGQHSGSRDSACSPAPS